MAAPTEAEMKAALKERVSSDLLFALSECGVALQWQHSLTITRGYNNLRLVAGIEESRMAVRQAFIDELRIGDDVPNRR